MNLKDFLMQLSKKFLFLLLLTFLFAGINHAKTVKHFKGEPADTLEAAILNLSSYNKKLAVYINQPSEITPNELHEIHQISYTLENALERLSAEVKDIQDLLEEVHLASEQARYDDAKNHGKAYLDKINLLVK